MRLNVRQWYVGGVALMYSSMLWAADFAPASAFCTFWNKFANPLVGVAAAVAMLVFFIMMVTNEGNGFISWGIKVMVAVSGGLAVPSILKLIGVSTLGMCN